MSDIAQKSPADLTPILQESLREIQGSRQKLENEFLSSEGHAGKMGFPFYKGLRDLFSEAEEKIARVCQASGSVRMCRDLEGDDLTSLENIFTTFADRAKHFSLGPGSLEDQRLHRHVLAAATTVGLVHSTISIQISNETARECLAVSQQLFHDLEAMKEIRKRKNDLGLKVLDGGLSGTPKL